MGDFKFYEQTNSKKNSQKTLVSHQMPSLSFYFIDVEEVGKDGFLVRRTYATVSDGYLRGKNLSEIEELRMVHPEKYGLFPVKPESQASVAQHVHSSQRFPSKYISTSSLFPEGSPKFGGKVVYIDIEKAKTSGAKLVSTKEILSALEVYKTKNPHLTNKINELADWVEHRDKEVLIEPKGSVPPKAIFTPTSLKVTKNIIGGARVLQVFAIFFTAYDLTTAAQKSYEIKSTTPIKHEVIKQAGGWGAAMAGARIGAVAGAAVGVETGPGAVISGLVGGVIFGTAGYFGSEWVMKYF